MKKPSPSTYLHRHKHLMLLIVAVSGLTIQPLLRFDSVGPIVYEMFGYALLLAVFLVIFQRGLRRWIALAIGVPAIVSNVAIHSLHGDPKFWATMTYHCLGVMFLSFAVGVILRDIFLSKRIGHDQILGACSGYMLAGVAWGNLYVVVDILYPGSFNVAPGLAWQLQQDDARRFLFNYFSFATLTTVGYGDVTPLAPAACSLAWLEAMFGQFYMAVFIGQLIGLKLIQPPEKLVD